MARHDHCSPEEHARRTSLVLGDETLLRVARMLLAAGETGRLRMLMALAEGAATVSVLAERLGVRLPHASQQLAVLRGAELVRSRRRGKHVEYTLVDDHIHELVRIALALSTKRR